MIICQLFVDVTPPKLLIYHVRVAVTLNILGLRRLLELCKKMGKLEVCVKLEKTSVEAR